MRSIIVPGLLLILSSASTSPLVAQTQNHVADPMVASIQDGAKHLRFLYTTAATQMTEADYAFKPTPDVRSFGQLLSHMAETSYYFCATALGEKVPGGDIEKTRTTKAEIDKALIESFDYCDKAYASMTDAAQANAMRKVMGSSRPALAVLNFRVYHSLLHWGNAITYMRLRGKVPPSTP
jgi:uncharacterized damage-inducible protein DinB